MVYNGIGVGFTLWTQVNPTLSLLSLLLYYNDNKRGAVAPSSFPYYIIISIVVVGSIGIIGTFGLYPLGDIFLYLLHQ